MMTRVDDVYTSTGIKYLRYLRRMKILQDERKASPITLQIALTDKCNLKCDFCSVANRNKTQEWEYGKLITAIDTFIELGIKSVEITGGGEPTIYKDFKKIIDYCYDKELKIGLITNGTMLMDIKDSIGKLTWLRISMNALDYITEIKIPKISENVTLGFSYVADEIMSLSGRLNRIVEYASKYNPNYVRIVPNCRKSIQQIRNESIKIKGVVEQHKDLKFFYQDKKPEKGGECLVGYFKPYLYTDGYVYPCSSVVLNEDSGTKFNEKYRWYNWKETKNIYKKEVKGINGSICGNCVYGDNNRILRSILHEIKHKEFI